MTKIKPRKSVRALLIFLLITVAVISAFGVMKYLRFATLTSLSVNTLWYFFAAMGSILLVGFVVVTVDALIRKSTLTKAVYIISIAFCIVAAATLLFFGYGLLQDIQGVRCAGFFGSDASCMLSPLLALTFIVLHPTALAVAGLIALYGVYSQLRR